MRSGTTIADNSFTDLNTISSSCIAKEKSAYFEDTPYKYNEGGDSKYSVGQGSNPMFDVHVDNATDDDDEFFDITLDSALELDLET